MPVRKMKFQSRITADWDRLPKVEGRVLAFDTMEVEGRHSRFALVDTEDGHVQVFESEGLKEGFATCAVGDFVSIEFLAMVETANKRRFRKFRIQVWEDPNAGPVPAVADHKVSTRGKGKR